jgi:acetylornithine aminotransferase/acetylornithine/N-succinyldiaminopimelate aminotransferase
VRRTEIVAAGGRFEVPSYARIDVVAARAEGCELFDLDGTRYLDLYGGHAVAILGHSPARVADAIAMQARDLLFYSNVVHLPVRARAAERLARLAPWPDAKVFFCNSGTEANETALKIARRATGRTRVVAFRGGFHGRTLGALAACGLPEYRDQAAPLVPDAFFRLADLNGSDLSYVDDTVAAVIVEPIQSMGGVRSLTRQFAQALRRRCDETGALLVFDEVQTAPARTGHWFAGGLFDMEPHMIATAKGIAGGFPAAIVLAQGSVAGTVRTGDQGTTFGGGPLACAAIEATLQALEEMDAPARARAIEERVRRRLRGREVLGHGALLGIRAPAKETVKRLREEHRVLAATCPGDATVVRLLPPLTITEAELDEGLAAIETVLQ